jgi:hypothetical protein
MEKLEATVQVRDIPVPVTFCWRTFREDIMENLEASVQIIDIPVTFRSRTCREASFRVTKDIILNGEGRGHFSYFQQKFSQNENF